MSNIMHGPFEVEIKVRLEIDPKSDGAADGATVTYSMPAGRYPTRAEMEAGVAGAIASVQSQFPDARPLDRQDFQNEILAEKTGHYMKYAAPAEWDK